MGLLVHNHSFEYFQFGMGDDVLVGVDASEIGLEFNPEFRSSGWVFDNKVFEIVE